MKKFVLIPDSFKGTLSSMEICTMMEEEIARVFPCAEIVSVPVADGGEGSVDCFLTALGGKKIFVDCHGPYMEKITAFYGLLADGETAVVEMSAAAGLPLVENRKNPLLTTTYGVGELILKAAEQGAKRIVVGLGGSCTNDFGCGAACACGIRFLDKKGREFLPVGETLKEVASIDASQKAQVLKDVEIVTMCDVDNLPYGQNGAAFVFARQKGADAQAIEALDAGVEKLCQVVEASLGIQTQALKGGGAAGAMGAGMVAFFQSTLKMGIQTVLETVRFLEIIKDADYIFTGEGKIDAQSLSGKVVIGVARAAKQKNVPVIAVVGGAEGDMSTAYAEGVTAVFPINRLPEDFSISRFKSQENLKKTMQDVLRLLRIKN